MSHNPERKEKDCLNCGTQVHGRFCHVCGQENIITKEKFWSLVKHFVYDILHFDGKFFHTLKYLFTKPGFVARQYAEGKRASYLHPIRMYLFTSAIFFLIFFSVNRINLKADLSDGATNEERLELAKKLEGRLARNSKDTVLHRRIALLKDTSRQLDIDSMKLRRQEGTFTIANKTYHSIKEYDSIQNSLPQGEKNGWFLKAIWHQVFKVREKYGRSNEGIKFLLETLLHKLPYLLFVSLPFFALLLKLLYIRRKNFYYSDHAVFTLYHYILSFILLLLSFGIGKLEDWLGWGFFGFLLTLLTLSWPLYLYLAMKNFYRQGRLKTFGKFLLLNFVGLIIIIILLLVFLLLSIFQL